MTDRDRAAALDRREVIVEGEIDDMQATMIIAMLLYLDDDDPDSPITMRVDSPGGVVTSSLAIVDTIDTIRAPVFTHAEGAAQGTAALIVASGCKGHRTATSASCFLLCRSHSVNPSNPEVTAREIRRVNAILAEMLSKATAMSLETVREEMKASRHLQPTAALALGLIDAIV